MDTVTLYAETKLPTKLGNMRLRVYRDQAGNEPFALIAGHLSVSQPIALRIHSACLTSEVLGSCKCDCKEQLDFALSYISEASGLIIYLHQEGRGLGLGDKIRVYAMQELGYDTIEANEILGFPVDNRSYDHAIGILKDLGVLNVDLLTNNPDKIQALRAAGINVKRIATPVPAHAQAMGYLHTKRIRMGHLP